MTLQEYLDQQNIFDLFLLVRDFPYFAENTRAMDLELKLYFGSKPLFSEIINVPLLDVAEIIVNRFGEKWDLLAQKQAVEIGSKETVTETNTSELEQETTGTDVNKVSGFNSSTMVDDTETARTGGTIEQGVGSKDVTKVKVDAYNTLLTLDQKAKSNIMETVVNDVKTMLTLSIY